jgi:anion-transporting  ArsA/GET3 family ATPase
MLSADLVMVTGKGGTGKSAVAAALALAAHRAGRRVLALAMDPTGTGLAAHLGAPPLSPQPSEVKPGLWASRIDRSKALGEYLRVQLGVPPFLILGPAVRAFDALASAAPAIREIITVGKVLWEVRRKAWDLVVADAPPTGQIGSYLRAARTIVELVPSGRIREQASWMEELLRDQATLCVVSIPEELPVNETVELRSWLTGEQVVGSTVVAANRVLPHLSVPDPVPDGPLGDAARLHLELWSEQQRWLEVLGADRRLPYLFGLMTPAEVAARLADEVEAW